jgi:hypothetical protein
MANYHFIDAWEGETGFAKINDQIVWADTHDAEGEKGISLCGRKDVAEGKFASKIDVTIPHTESFLKLSFGATLDEHAVSLARLATQSFAYTPDSGGTLLCLPRRSLHHSSTQRSRYSPTLPLWLLSPPSFLCSATSLTPFLACRFSCNKRVPMAGRVLCCLPDGARS